MQSETRIEKAGFRLETNKVNLMHLKKRLFKNKNDFDFRLDQTVGKKTEVPDPTRQWDPWIGNVRKSSRIYLFLRASHTHTATRHATQRHTTTSSTLA